MEKSNSTRRARSASTHQDASSAKKPIVRAILEWTRGTDQEPTLYVLAGSDEESRQIAMILSRIAPSATATAAGISL